MANYELQHNWVTPRGLNQGYRETRYAPAKRRGSVGGGFKGVISGDPKASDEYVNTLKGIYDSYGKHADEYGNKARSIIDAIGGDIEGIQGFGQEYSNELAANKDTFLNGIVLDPNADRTRAEYTGAVADQYDTTRETLKRNMSSQGLNPYANKGADRELAMDKARATGLASGQAYTDWRKGYNQDKQSQQQATGAYLGLKAREGDYLGDVVNARGMQGGLEESILSANNTALGNRGRGYEGLRDVQEGRLSQDKTIAQQNRNNESRERIASNSLDSTNELAFLKSGLGDWKNPGVENIRERFKNLR